MKAKPLLALALLLAFASFLLVWRSVESIPTVPPCAGSEVLTQACVRSMQNYVASLSAVASGFWVEMLWVAGAVAMSAVAVMLVRLGVTFNLRKVLSVLCIGAGLWFFAMLCVVNLLPGDAITSLNTAGGVWAVAAANVLTVRLHAMFPFVGYDGFGLIGFLSLTVAALGLVAFKIEHGFLAALKYSLLRLVFPAILCLEVGILAFMPSAMSLHVADFTAPLYYCGVYLLNNWVVLAVSACLTAYGFLFYGREWWMKVKSSNTKLKA